jgi:hypothetical protein
MATPRGIRNKNPGNLRYSSSWNWKGVAGVDDKQFAIFESAEWGLYHFAKQLERYKKRGLDTLAKIIPIYAPKSDNNDEAAYIRSVEVQTGIDKNTVLDLQDRVVLEKLMRAFTRHEQGMPPNGLDDWYDDATYDRALDLFRPISDSRTIRGSVIGGAVLVAEAVKEVAFESAQQASDVATTAAPFLPSWSKWIFLAVGLAGIGLAIYARLEARSQGKR